MVCMGITGVIMLILGIDQLLGAAQIRFDWLVVTGSGAANCAVSLVILWAIRRRREGTPKN